MNVLVVKLWNAEFFEISKCLQGIEASNEVIEDHSDGLHNGQMILVKDRASSYAELYISTLKSWAFKNEAIFDFWM